MSYDSNKYQDSEGVYPPPPPPPCPPPMQGYYEAGPHVAPPRVSDPMKYGPQHLQQPPPPERTSQRDDDFGTGCCCC
ncbi:hypothetical protein POPTR_012G120952v4 [Populus trichocarpa]|uniref:Uncharacterized protein n=2 Tax=Populus trichocarpa TaxID=3694 RepID=A0ACC0S5M5_POPTR|nr:protein CYSTEINE-RICH TRANSMEMBRANE MODULE 10 [Populus trichocarpa]KAI9384860.1 hypothetical protein POPTR_012G120952v4 [Populus trichocarpa]|eukprot:XP_024448519.1 leucine-rich repeat extensin-like protein 3 [Populus trichocarpa]